MNIEAMPYGDEWCLRASGRGKLPHLGMYVRCVDDAVAFATAATGQDVPDPREAMRYKTGDEDAGDPLTPLIVVLQDRPGWTVWEHDRSAIAYFNAVADALGTQGYHAWAGIPDERAVLAARRMDDDPAPADTGDADEAGT